MPIFLFMISVTLSVVTETFVTLKHRKDLKFECVTGQYIMSLPEVQIDVGVSAGVLYFRCLVGTQWDTCFASLLCS